MASAETPEILVENLNYRLDESLIAKFPKAEREKSKLLIINDNGFQSTVFQDISLYIPKNSLLLLNDSRVFPARVHTQRKSGGTIELLLTRALLPNNWLALAKNSKRWKIGETVTKKFDGGLLAAKLVAIQGLEVELELYWEPANWTLEAVLLRAGEVPLPPYMNRAATEIDHERYQTVYAATSGSAAAPTAGLHFTENLMNVLVQQGHQFSKITLHVGPGTFLPVKTHTLNQHEMHLETCCISVSNLEKLTQQSPLVAVGTTTLRSLESFYWSALPLTQGGHEPLQTIPQFIAFQQQADLLPDYRLVFGALKNYLITQKSSDFWIQTKLLLAPGACINTANYLITNFHQPKSTLLALVEAFAGPVWKAAYEYAQSRNYRFLSYGDACLFSRKNHGLK